jgi:hypothetical protein
MPDRGLPKASLGLPSDRMNEDGKIYRYLIREQSNEAAHRSKTIQTLCVGWKRRRLDVHDPRGFRSYRNWEGILKLPLERRLPDCRELLFVRKNPSVAPLEEIHPIFFIDIAIYLPILCRHTDLGADRVPDRNEHRLPDVTSGSTRLFR